MAFSPIQYMIFYNFTPANPDLEHFQYTDSKSLLGRISTSLARFYPSPRACLASEFDLEIAIRNSIQQLGLQITRKHVKGHQDDAESRLEVLPWPAQLNVVCDHLASHQLRISELDPTVLHNPYCHAYVTIRGESVMGQIRKALFDAKRQTSTANLPPCQATLVQRNFPAGQLGGHSLCHL
jgi:hypothetical protein